VPVRTGGGEGAGEVRNALSPPAGLAEFERIICADTAPDVVIIDSCAVRALLTYVRALEAAQAVVADERPGAWPSPEDWWGSV
jgi:hypothetical protein